ncbi:MAG UNVERIFIED_CONTAM: hypothetical protein LVR18_24990 [Planctomycetaceae bacterium]
MLLPQQLLLADGWTNLEVHTVMSKVVAAADRTELAQFPGGMMFERLLPRRGSGRGDPRRTD